MASPFGSSSLLDQKKVILIQEEVIKGKGVVALLKSRPQVPDLVDPLINLLNGIFDQLLTLVGTANSVGIGSSSSDDQVKSTEKFGRGVYRRRISSSPLRQLTSRTTKDGYKWKKYGQKRINGYKHPRSYFYCYHKDQGCKAARQVQMTNSDPSLLVITYINSHTCKQVAPDQTLSASLSTSLKEESTLSFGSTTYNDITHTARPPRQLSSSVPSDLNTMIPSIEDHDDFNFGTYSGSMSDYEDAVPAGLNSSFGSLDSLIGSDPFDGWMDGGAIRMGHSSDEATMFNFDEGDFFSGPELGD